MTRAQKRRKERDEFSSETAAKKTKEETRPSARSGKLKREVEVDSTVTKHKEVEEPDAEKGFVVLSLKVLQCQKILQSTNYKRRIPCNKYFPSKDQR